MIAMTITSRQRDQWIEITGQLEKYITDLHWDTGVVNVFVPHTTAGVTVNENADPDVLTDLINMLDHLVPWKGSYRHREGNSAAHLKASLMGCSVSLLVESGKLRRGTWQGVYFCEFDGPRTRQCWITFTSTEKS
jgi:secondary thiamine-phosphate synthase enzyme